MASTISGTTFQVTVKEEHIVKDVRTLNETLYKVSDVTNFDRRIVTCPNTTSIDLFNLNGTNPGAGTFPSSSLQYARITNLDDTYSVAVIVSGSQGTFTQELTPTDSLFLASSNITSSNFNGSFGDDIEVVQIYAISSSVDIEYTLVNS